MDLVNEHTRVIAKLNALIKINDEDQSVVTELKAMTATEINAEYKSVFNTGMTPNEIIYFMKRPHLNADLSGVLIDPNLVQYCNFTVTQD